MPLDKEQQAALKEFVEISKLNGGINFGIEMTKRYKRIRSLLNLEKVFTELSY